ncbi:Smr/MutS family protein [Oceanospirillum sediminis]|uniref:Smr/MutS family protein n=1 Tax=Oceanospirillum sediminis TaxID=2760088 RepID=A0A839IQN1_9GAMM|nr:Smr/MutS family protein [Oceanospirillum sediminis]MBB1487020.1 Smr/MutS family protein [Oceanospirillum sediminis]
MSKYNPADDTEMDDMALFQQAMQGVKPIESNKVVLKPKKKDINTRLKREAATQADEKFVVDNLTEGNIPDMKPSDILSFMIPDLPIRTFQSLKKGEYQWQEGLDLHGQSVEEARAELYAFIQDCRARRFRCVVVVHGKSWTQGSGRAELKSYVNVWLRQMSDVIAFHSCLPADGGTGAVYVLLKTKNDI